MVAGETLGIVASVAQQETARAFGDQGHFSWGQMWQSGFTNAAAAGLSAGLAIPNSYLPLQFQTSITSSEEMAVSMQLVQLALGYQHKFDWKTLIAAALQPMANSRIDRLIPTPLGSSFARNFGNNVSKDFTQSAISSEVETRRFNAETAAAQALGNFIGAFVAQQAQQAYQNATRKRMEQRAYQNWQQQVAALNSEVTLDGQINQGLNDELQGLDINPFTDEPLNQPSDPDDSDGSAQANNPSARQQQSQQDQSESRAQRWSAQQQGRQTSGANTSSQSSGWLSFFSQQNMQQQALQQAFAEGKYASYTGQPQANVGSLSPAEQAQYYAGMSAGKADGIANAEVSVLGFAELGVGILGRFGLFAARSEIINSSADLVNLSNSLLPEDIGPSELASFTNRVFGDVKPGLYYQAQRFGQVRLGQYFTPIKPINSMDAEEMLNIKAWGNNGDQLTTVEIKSGLQAWQGGVQGGAGQQLFIPQDFHSEFVNVLDVEPLFVEELKWITRP